MRTLALLLLALPVVAHAQTPVRFVAEVRGGLAFPTGEWNQNNTVGIGYGGGLTGQAWFTPTLGAYGGFDWRRFSVDLGDSSLDSHSTDSGFSAGLVSSFNLTGPSLTTPFLLVGGVMNRTSSRVSNGTESAGVDSDRPLGFEIGGGASTRLANGLLVTPAIRYRSHSVFFPASDFSSTVAYVMIDFGVALPLSR